MSSSELNRPLPKEEVMAVRLFFGELATYTLLGAESNWRERMTQLI